MTPTPSLVVRGGDVVDGTGGPALAGDVAVRDGRIVAVGEGVAGVLDGGGPVTELDASGCVVTPGFIDLHTHYDAQVLWDPTCSSSCWQGVTTVVVGQLRVLARFRRRAHHDLVVGMLHDLEDMSPDVARRHRLGLRHVPGVPRRRRAPPAPRSTSAAYVATRRCASTCSAPRVQRAATPAEVDAMRERVDAALAAGAIGFATSASPTGRNCPSKHAAARRRTSALVDVLGRRGAGGLASFVPGGVFTHEALLRPAAPHRAPLHLDRAAHDARRPLTTSSAAIHRAGRARVAPTCTRRCRAGRSSRRPTSLSPFALRCPAIRELDRATPIEREAAYADPAWRSRARAELATSLLPPQWNHWVLAASVLEAASIGATVGALGRAPAASTRSTSCSTCRWPSTSRPRFTVTMANDDEAAVDRAPAARRRGAGAVRRGAHPDSVVRRRAPSRPARRVGARARGARAGARGAQAHGRAGAAARALRPWRRAAGCGGRPRGAGPRCGGARDRCGGSRDLPADGDRLVADAPMGLRHVVVGGTPIHRDGRSLVAALDGGPGQVLRPGS